MINVLFEDNHIIIINKEAGDLVQGDSTGDETILDKTKSYLKKKYKKPGKVFLGLVHRIDRPTSGIVICAKTSKALSRLNEQFKERSVQKKYWAIVKNPFSIKSGTLANWIAKNSKLNKSFVFEKKNSRTKKAILNFKIYKKIQNYTLLEIILKTGRHHQIRVQLSNIGYPIVGDLKYGAKRSNPDASISLHSAELSFEHPVRKELIQIKANPPKKHLWNAFLYDS